MWAQETPSPSLGRKEQRQEQMPHANTCSSPRVKPCLQREGEHSPPTSDKSQQGEAPKFPSVRTAVSGTSVL